MYFICFTGEHLLLDVGLFLEHFFHTVIDKIGHKTLVNKDTYRAKPIKITYYIQFGSKRAEFSTVRF